MATIWRWTVAGTDATGQQQWNSTMHYVTDVPLGEGEPSAETVLEKLINHYGTSGAGTGMERWLVTICDGVKLTRCSVYEELDEDSTAVPEAASQDFTLNGGAGVIDAGNPQAMCVWINFTTGFASRSSRGGTHLALERDQNHLTSVGLWDTSLSWWSQVTSLAGYMKEPLSNVFGSGTPSGDINPVVYSRTRRGRDQSPYTFPISGATPSARPRWLRRRDIGN